MRRLWLLVGVFFAVCGGSNVTLPATPMAGTATVAVAPSPTVVFTPTPLAAASTATSAPLPRSALTPTPFPSATVALPTATSGVAVASAGQAVTVTAGDTVNLRSEPDTGAAVIAPVPLGAEAFVTQGDVSGSDGSYHWVRVTYQGKDGYLRSDLVGPPHAPAPVSSPITPTVAVPKATAQVTTVASDYQVAASVSNSTPTDNSRVTVTARLTQGGKGVSGATMSTTWHYKTTTSACTGGPSGTDGAMSCTRDISRATKGYTVENTVTVTYQGQAFRTSTGFIPR